MKALIIDDDEAVGNLLTKLLSSYEIETVISKNGCNGLEEFIRDDFDLIILDSGLPDMTGEDVYKEVRKIDDTIFIALSSGYPDFDELESDNEYNLILHKPYCFEQLRSIIDIIKGALK